VPSDLAIIEVRRRQCSSVNIDSSRERQVRVDLITTGDPFAAAVAPIEDFQLRVALADDVAGGGVLPADVQSVWMKLARSR